LEEGRTKERERGGGKKTNQFRGGLWHIQGPSIRKKNDDFILERTTTKSIQFIYKPVFLFRFFPCCCFASIRKAATTIVLRVKSVPD
jgi:hypothetical protein